MLTAQVLADDLTEARMSDFVRVVADWLDRASKDGDLQLEAAPRLTGRTVLDALVAAAAAHALFRQGLEVPQWTTERSRRTESLWYPGPDALLPNALVHSPLSFSIRGLLIEIDSLESV